MHRILVDLRRNLGEKSYIFIQQTGFIVNGFLLTCSNTCLMHETANKHFFRASRLYVRK